MILDKQNVFDWDAALTSTRASTDIIDLVSKRDVGSSYVDNPNLKVRVQVGSTSFASTGSSTLVITFEGSTDASTWDTYISVPSIAKASMTANAVLADFAVPNRSLGKSLPRYLRLNYTVGTADFTAGALKAFLFLDDQANIAYPQGVNVTN